MVSGTLDRVLEDRTTEVPLYRHIEEDLLSQITQGSLQSGDMIPAERELCEHYGVSRITVRRAISELETRGYVQRYQGKGTFVSRTRIKREMGQLLSFSEEMRSQGHAPGSKLLNLQHRGADASIASALQLEEGEPVWIVERLRLADDEVISLSISYLHLPMDTYLTPLELGGGSSLWSLLADKGIHITEGNTSVRAAVADSHYAALLGVAEGDPLLVREGVNYSAKGQSIPVEAFEIVSRADRYQYSLHLIRQTKE
jgi:GntR family transcriptional regulator